jgi:bifunctional ADP-heptose synthase (sugar kinase/adenylyltransferase)
MAHMENSPKLNRKQQLEFFTLNTLIGLHAAPLNFISFFHISLFLFSLHTTNGIFDFLYSTHLTYRHNARKNKRSS